MFSTFDLCLLLYVIRLDGWLKHCNLSLSLFVRLKFEPLGLGQIALRSEGHAYAWAVAASDVSVSPRSLIAERLCDMLRKDKLLASLPTKAFSNLVIITRHVQRTV